ncbi:MAG: hypothetical protein JW737_09670 [Acidobacteria bacterium]|nr:hypothetical protein [Acidobacteriota bacterium]
MKIKQLFTLFILFAMVSIPLGAYKGSKIESIQHLMQEFLPKLYNYNDWTSIEQAKYYVADDSTLKNEKITNVQSLWEYIDGAAEIYNQYGFEMMQIKRYNHKTVKNAEITLEIYRMKDPINAFGIYSYERSGIKEFLDIRQEGYYVKDALTFWRGNYYVKLTQFGFDDPNGDLLKKMAMEISELIADATPPPAAINMFPDRKNTKPTAVYIAGNLLGLEMLGDGFQADYQMEGKSYKLFLKLIKDEDTAEALFEKLNEFLGKRGQIIEAPDEWDSDIIMAYDNTMLGNVVIFLKGNTIAGVSELETAKDGFKAAEELYKSIK